MLIDAWAHVLLGAAFVALVVWRAVPWWWTSRRRLQLWRRIPSCPDEHWLLGQGLALACASAPWHTLNKWLASHGGPIVRFRILNRLAVILDDPTAVRRIFQTHFKAYPKDTAFCYGTFLSILGTGLVTSEGAIWQEQRLLMAPALRVDLLHVVLPVAHEACDRLAEKLQRMRGTGQAIDIASELRHLTLQVIGNAMMSLKPEECDEVESALGRGGG